MERNVHQQNVVVKKLVVSSNIFIDFVVDTATTIVIAIIIPLIKEEEVFNLYQRYYKLSDCSCFHYLVNRSLSVFQG